MYTAYSSERQDVTRRNHKMLNADLIRIVVETRRRELEREARHSTLARDARLGAASEASHEPGASALKSVRPALRFQ